MKFNNFEEPMAGKGKTPMENAFLEFVDRQRAAKVAWREIPVFRDWVDSEYNRLQAAVARLRGGGE